MNKTRLGRLLARSSVSPTEGMEINKIHTGYRVSGAHLLVDIASDPRTVKSTGSDADPLAYVSIDVHKRLAKVNNCVYFILKRMSKIHGR